MRRWLPFLIPFGVVLAAGVGAKIWSLSTGTRPCADFDEVAVGDLDSDLGCVRVTGQAHYEVVVRQTVKGNLLHDEQQLFLFPLFREGDMDERAVRVLVRTEREPEGVVNYETMTIEGRLQPVTADSVPFGTDIEIGKRSNYFFTDDMVLLVPETVTVDGQRWVSPATQR